MAKIYSVLKSNYRKNFTFLFLLLAFSSQLFSQTHTPITVKITNRIGGYWEYLPADYNTSGKKYPLILFFHGSGELGSGSQADLKKVLKWGPTKLIANGSWPKTFTVNGESFTPIVISPQYRNTSRSLDDYKALMAYVLKKYRIDESRIYMTGLSHGGGTAIYYPSISDDGANKVAAVVTSAESVYGNAAGIARFAKVDMPLWMCSNRNDPKVPIRYSLSWYDGLKDYSPRVSPQPLMDIFDQKGHDSWSKMYDPNYRPRGLNVYEWMFQFKRGKSDDNNYPSSVTAKIVAPETVDLPKASISLDGSQSTTSTGTSIKSYSWKCVSGPAGYKINNASSAKSTLTNLSAGKYQVELSVTNSAGVTDNASATILVVANKPPVAVMKDVASITLPVDAVVLNGGSSYDPDGVIKSYKWSYVSGAKGYKISSPSTAVTTLSNLGIGTYRFMLTVKDEKGSSNSVAKSFTVYASSEPPKALIKGPSVVNGSSVTLDGSGSKAASGRKIVKYNWKQIAGPEGFSVNSIAKSKIVAWNLKPGSYISQLTVTDDKGKSSSARIALVVYSSKKNERTSIADTGKLALSANETFETATIDQLGAVETAVGESTFSSKSSVAKGPTAVVKGPTTVKTTTITLDGTSSYATSGRRITKYKWKQISGPKGYTVNNAYRSTITGKNLKPGKYVSQLTVRDNTGAGSTVQIAFEVVAPSTQLDAPVAVITGASKITLPDNSLKLTGRESYAHSNSTVKNKIKSYAWSQTSGPAYEATGVYDSTMSISGLKAGAYSTKLTVTDEQGKTGTTTFSFQVTQQSTTDNCGCDVTLEKNSDGSVQATNVTDRAPVNKPGTVVREVSVKPGNTVCIKGGIYNRIRLIGFNGTATSPIKFKNCGGQVVINGATPWNIFITNSSYFQFSGTGSADKYGFKITTPGKSIYGGLGIKVSTESTDFEFNNIEINRASIGLMIKTDPTCDPITWQQNGALRNVKLHDLYVHDVLNEAFYVGYSFPYATLNCSGVTKNIYPQLFYNLKIYNNVVDSSGWDGIQVASAPEGTEVYNNTVSNFGVGMKAGQMSGILISPGATASVYNNKVSNGPGAGIMIMGQSKNYIYNNLVVNVGDDKNPLSFGQSGIFIDDRPRTGAPALTVFVSNNTIVSPKRFGVYQLNSYGNVGSDNYFYNNFFIMTGIQSYNMGKPIVSVVKNKQSNNITVYKLAAAKFIDAAGNNYGLTSSSPARGKALNILSLLSGLKTDIVGVQRLLTWDAGSYQYSTGATTASRTATDSAIVALERPTAIVNNTIDVDLTSSQKSVTLDGSKSVANAGAVLKNYQWRYISGPSQFSLGDQALSQAKLSDLNEGVYTFELKVTDNNNMSDSALVKVSVSNKLKIDNTLGATVLKMAPVPAIDYLNLSLNNNTMGKVTIRVSDMNGRMLVLQNGNAKEMAYWQDRVDVSKLSSGMYFAEVMIGNQKFTGKFVKAGK
ncbi:right-handed parallel beta-helix repeat-containing protein [Danxiaibacter flavus]|uniref:Right-handed parallel beta-helix repeat-containing protein n=1 Tax=Danxiaibacter flavus TaxID=3049108 RepID=A0ABV3ZCA0_9BACT|nr:right-handed parallel beta-helix repeat-containing protein [Chitinophagaceae bacterium DXS]